ncbi:hypothetical protein ACFFQA_17550, partial [Allokutzneria oryzae]
MSIRFTGNGTNKIPSHNPEAYFKLHIHHLIRLSRRSSAKTTWPILTESHDALRTAVAAVTDWEAATPCSQWNATQV